VDVHEFNMAWRDRAASLPYVRDHTKRTKLFCLFPYSTQTVEPWFKYSSIYVLLIYLLIFFWMH
jgi:hypothetical protein